MSTARYFPAAATGPDGRIYVIGGFGLSSVEAYDPRTGHWTSVAPMHTVRFAPAAVTGPDGRIYVMGGATGLSGYSDLDTVEVYDTLRNTWTMLAPMPTRRSALAAALGPDGRIYAVGGSNSSHVFLDTVEAYDFATNSWTTMAPVPTPRFSFGAATGPDGRVYAIGGFSADGSSSAVEALTPPPPPPVPGPPIDVRATAGNESVTLTWLPPFLTGGGLTGYTVTVYAGNTGTVVMHLLVNADTTRATVPGLTNGQTYTFTVSAQSDGGSGPESGRSNAATPGTVPTAPGHVQAAAGQGHVTVSWTTPTSNGGRPITGYTVAAYLDVSFTPVEQFPVGAGLTTTTLTGLALGKTYSFTVTAHNVLGSSDESDRSNLVTLATEPEAPSHVQAAPIVGGLTVSWAAPSSDGGSPITRYIVSIRDTTTGQTVDVHVTGSTTSTTVNSLLSGHSYSVTVTAVNALGESVASAPSIPVTLPSAPGVPTNVRVTPGDTSATITWTAPTSNGGAPITAYVVTASDGAHSPLLATSTTTGLTLTGLVNDVTYSISVAAVNAVGQSAPATATVTPRNLPPALLPLQDRSIQYSDELSFDVSATDAEAGDRLTLGVSGLPGGLTFTDHGNGSGTVTGVVQAAAGAYPVTVSVSDGRNPAVSRTMMITVNPEAATVSLSTTNPSAIALKGRATTTKSLSLAAVIGEVSDTSPGRIADAGPITCTLTGLSSNVTYSRTATVSSASAQNTLAASCRFSRLPVDEFRIEIVTSGERYKGAADGMLAVYRANKAVLHASGSLVHDGAPGDVTASAHYASNGHPKGSLRYIEYQSAGDVTLQSGRITGMVVRNGHVYLQGTATVNGVEGFHFVAWFFPGTSSQLGLWVTDPTNQTVTNLTFDPILLTRGRVTIPHR